MEEKKLGKNPQNTNDKIWELKGTLKNLLLASSGAWSLLVIIQMFQWHGVVYFPTKFIPSLTTGTIIFKNHPLYWIAICSPVVSSVDSYFLIHLTCFPKYKEWSFYINYKPFLLGICHIPPIVVSLLQSVFTQRWDPEIT